MTSVGTVSSKFLSSASRYPMTVSSGPPKTTMVKSIPLWLSLDTLTALLCSRWTPVFSGVIVLLCFTSSVLKLLLPIFFQFWCCFRQENTSGPCYFILTMVRSLSVVPFTLGVDSRDGFSTHVSVLLLCSLLAAVFPSLPSNGNYVWKPFSLQSLSYWQLKLKSDSFLVLYSEVAWII